MQSRYRVHRMRSGMVALVAAFIPLAVPSTGIAADTTPVSGQVEPLARGAGVGRPGVALASLRERWFACSNALGWSVAAQFFLMSGTR